MKILITVVFYFTLHCGNFAQCNVANTPQDVTEEHTVNLSFLLDSIDIETVSFCLKDAILEDSISCFNTITSGVNVWGKINSPDFTNTFLYTAISANNNLKAKWSFYELLNGTFEEVSSCNDKDVSPEVSRYEFTLLESVYVKISIPTEVSLTEMDSVEIKAFINPFFDESPCYTSDVDGGGEEFINIEIVERSIGNLDNAILLPGEEITIEVEAQFNSEENDGLVWLQTVIPALGSGWDHDYFYDSIPDEISASTPLEWIASDSECSGVFNEPLSMLCTFEDDKGRLILCNVLTHNCPCDPGVMVQDSLPNGFYAVSGASGQNCANDCTPSGGYGVFTGTNVTFSGIFKLKVKENSLYNDLSFGFHMLPDNITGCWVDFEANCRNVTPLLSNTFKSLNLTNPIIFTEVDEFVCDDKLINLTFIKNNILLDSISINFSPNENVIFSAGEQIETNLDELSFSIDNLTGVRQNIIFTLSGKDTDGEDYESENYSFILLPSLEVEEVSIELCSGGCKVVDISTNYDSFASPQIIWSDGSIGSSRLMCDGDPNRSGVAINDFGCDSIPFEVEILVDSSNNYDLVVPELYCGSEATLVVVTGLDPNSNTIIDWEVDFGFGPVVFTGTEQLFLNEEFLQTAGDSIRISVSIFDVNGCNYEITKTRPVINVANQIFDSTVCITDLVGPLELILPFFKNQNLDIESIEKVIGFENASFAISGDDLITLTIQNPEKGEAIFELLVIYTAGCTQSFSYELNLLDVYNGTITTNIVDFEVDFGFSILDGITGASWDFGDGYTSDELFPSHIYQEDGTYTVIVNVVTICGESTQEFSITIGTTDINEVGEKKVNITPNPATDVLYIYHELLKPSEVFILDNTGKIILSKSLGISNEQFLDISELSAGVYFVRLNSEQYTIVKRVVIID